MKYLKTFENHGLWKDHEDTYPDLYKEMEELLEKAYKLLQDYYESEKGEEFEEDESDEDILTEYLEEIPEDSNYYSGAKELLKKIYDTDYIIARQNEEDFHKGNLNTEEGGFRKNIDKSFKEMTYGEKIDFLISEFSMSEKEAVEICPSNDTKRSDLPEEIKHSVK